jgi:hypothetical protein
MNHTLTPWTVEPEEWTDGKGIAIVAPGIGIVAIIDPEGAATAEDTANAEFIVRACNNPRPACQSTEVYRNRIFRAPSG